MPVDPLVNRYRLPQVILPVDPDDIANKAYVDANSGGVIALIETQVASGSQSEFDFTGLSLANADVAAILFEIDGAVSAAANLNLEIDDIVSANQNTNGVRVSAGVQTIINLAGQTFFTLLTSTILFGANRGGRVWGQVLWAGVGSELTPVVLAKGAGRGTVGYEDICGSSTGAMGPTLDALRFFVSAGNFVDGSRCSIYRVNRA